MSFINDFFLSESSKKLLNKWITGDYKKKPLCICGKSGLGFIYLTRRILGVLFMPQVFLQIRALKA